MTDEAKAPIAAEPDVETEYSDDEGEAAVEWETLPPEKEFYASPYDPPVKSLVQEIRDKELIVRPSFQRYGVWDTTRKSRFVESLLLNIPIPNLFFAEDDDKTKVVVDGQQRLLAVYEFLSNRFALRGLEVLAPLNGISFDDLTERQQRIIQNRTLRCLLISAKSDSEIRFQVFERLNQGGMPLNAQEVRHCVYRGSFNDFLHALAADPRWLSLAGVTERHPRMLDCELFLRYFAIRNALPTYAPPLKPLMNEYMRQNRHADKKALEQLSTSFWSSIESVRAAFGAEPFRRYGKNDKGQVLVDRVTNRAVFDIEMLVMEGLKIDWAKDNAPAIKAALRDLCIQDPIFNDSVSRATADKTKMAYRLRKWKEALLALGAELPALPRLP
jgi:hypothetical protein